MKALVKENIRHVPIGNSALRASKMKEGDTYSSPHGIIDQCRAQAKTAEKYKEERGNRNLQCRLLLIAS